MSRRLRALSIALCSIAAASAGHTQERILDYAIEVNVGGTKFMALDKATGKTLWSIDLGVGQNGTPMTYLHDGKQYVVVAVGSTDYPAELVALALP